MLRSEIDKLMEQDMMIKEMSPQRAAVLAVLQKAARPLRLFEIAAATGMKPANAASLLYDMKRDGQVDYTGLRSMRYWGPPGASWLTTADNIRWRRSPYRHIKGLIRTTADHG
jgi:IclR helix-turn-helix domain